MKELKLLLLICLSVFCASAQELSGVAMGKNDQKPVQGVNISLREKGSSQVIAYGTTQANGSYKITYKSNADSITITVTALNFERILATKQNIAQKLDFQLNPGTIVLKEIKVKPPRASKIGDTINILTSGFSDKNDRTIGDVLKKIPGIKVASDGSITYNNLPINRFYIENQDLLQGRYGLATNNIEAKDVKSVQVLENHQPVKALAGAEFTDQAALNLKLTDSAKNILIANTEIGIGAAPLLWQNELFGMYFSKKRQSIFTYKGNNTGNDAAADSRSLYGGDANMAYPVSLYAQSPIDPGIAGNRYLDNSDHALSLSNLWSLKKDEKIVANISFRNDRRIRSSYSQTSNFLPGQQVLDISENIHATEKLSQLNAQVNFNRNTETLYLDNSLKFYGQLSTVDGSIINGDTLAQYLEQHLFKLSNNFELVRNIKNISYKFFSYNGYSRNSQSLSISPLVYTALFPQAGIDGMVQDLFQNYFASYSKMAVAIKSGAFRQNYTFGYNIDVQKLISGLYASLPNGRFINGADSLSNNTLWKSQYFFLQPDYSYLSKKLKINVQLPLSYFYRQINNKYVDRKTNGYFFFLPSVSLQYKISNFWGLSANGGYYSYIAGMENGYTGYIMQSYRSLIRNAVQLPQFNSQTVSASISYKNPITSLYITAGSNLSKNTVDLTYGSNYMGILAIQKSYAIPNESTSYGFQGNIDKGFTDTFIQRITLGINQSTNEGEQVLQDTKVNIRSTGLGASAGIDLKPTDWSIINYTISYSENRSYFSGDIPDAAPVKGLLQGIKVNFFPLKGITINVACSYAQNSAFNGTQKATSFTDLAIKYKQKKIELKLEYNNIFNLKQYLISNNTAFGNYYALFDLRPAQVMVKARFKLF
ncbi:hypothetical protein [Pedobacter miscanthi]|uniref:hypothetical protein n=1 Tax=Pedobacter miscanthi TaxID=2259170 RepID=UPI00292FA6A4|nr:hypothetical protein [Pedobacter miscanthi]